MTRLSRYFLPTLKEAPADAEALSHKLLVRAGLVRQVGAGLWTFLPAGWRAHRKAEQIIREELDAIGGQGRVVPGVPPPALGGGGGPHRVPGLFQLQASRAAGLGVA